MLPCLSNVAGIEEGCGPGCSKMSGLCLTSVGIPVVKDSLALLNIVLRPMSWYLTHIHAMY